MTSFHNECVNPKEIKFASILGTIEKTNNDLNALALLKKTVLKIYLLNIIIANHCCLQVNTSREVMPWPFHAQVE